MFYQGLLSDYITTCRRHHSFETSLLRLTEDWKASRDRKELVAVVSMDLSKAFDTIPHALLLAKLSAYGLNGSACALLEGNLSVRMQRMKIGDAYASWPTVRRGVPQGSVLGPMFFNIFLNGLFYVIKEVKLHAYADDEQLYDSDSDPIALDQRMQREIRKANTWYTENGMIVNPSKHHAMVLGSTDHQFSLTTKDLYDLLGMTIDSRLNFDKLDSTDKSREKLEMLGLESIIRELKHQTFLIHERHGWLRRTGSGTRFACQMQIIK